MKKLFSTLNILAGTAAVLGLALVTTPTAQAQDYNHHDRQSQGGGNWSHGGQGGNWSHGNQGGNWSNGQQSWHGGQGGYSYHHYYHQSYGYAPMYYGGQPVQWYYGMYRWHHGHGRRYYIYHNTR